MASLSESVVRKHFSRVVAESYMHVCFSFFSMMRSIDRLRPLHGFSSRNERAYGRIGLYLSIHFSAVIQRQSQNGMHLKKIKQEFSATVGQIQGLDLLQDASKRKLSRTGWKLERGGAS